MEEKDKRKIRDSVQESFIERNENTIAEKISFFIKKGFTEDEAYHAIIQIMKNLSNYFLNLSLPLKEIKSEEIVYSDELILSGNLAQQNFSEWPRQDETVNDED